MVHHLALTAQLRILLAQTKPGWIRIILLFCVKRKGQVFRTNHRYASVKDYELQQIVREKIGDTTIQVREIVRLTISKEIIRGAHSGGGLIPIATGVT